MIRDLTAKGVDMTPTTVAHDLFLRKFLEYHLPYEVDWKSLLERMDFTNFSKMQEDDLIKFAGNFFGDVLEGVRASNHVRLFYEAPQAVSVPSGTGFSTEAGDLAFTTEEDQSIGADDMVLQLDGPHYYFDVLVVAEETGEEFNVPAGAITQCDNAVITSQTVRIENVVPFTNGAATERAEDLFHRTRESITVLNLANNKSIAKVVRDAFPDIARVHVIRAKDDLMFRDRLMVDIDSVPTEVRVGNMVDVYLDSTEVDTFRTVIFNNESDTIPFGYGALDFEDNPIDRAAYRIIAVRVSDASGELTGDELDAEDWTYTQVEHHENSVHQAGVLTILDGDYDSGAHYFEVEYLGCGCVPQVQALLLSDEERMPVGDYLARGFFLTLLSGSIQYVGPTSVEVMQQAVNNFLAAFSAQVLEVSDLVDVMYQAGATKVTLPITLAADRQDGTDESFQDVYELDVREMVAPFGLVVVKIG